MDSEDGRLNPKALKALGCAGEGPRALEAPDRRLHKCSMPVGLDYEELGGLSDPGQQDCLQA